MMKKIMLTLLVVLLTMTIALASGDDWKKTMADAATETTGESTGTTMTDLETEKTELPMETKELPKGVSVLPLDFSAGKVPQKSGYNKEEMTYSDPSLEISIMTERVNKCDVWVASIKVADASQLRTMSAGGFKSSGAAKGESLAKRVNAVLAIDGDYFSYTGEGYILRQGQTFLNVLRGDRDVLAIDSKGDFHAFHLPKDDEVLNAEGSDQFVNAFYFGPILVENGEVQTFRNDESMRTIKKSQRMAICQVGPLEYKMICCGPPARGNAGMTLAEFAEYVATQNVKIAYNLDGGDSTMMIFDGKKINDVRSTTTRKIVDIVYVASAYEP